MKISELLKSTSVTPTERASEVDSKKELTKATLSDTVSISPLARQYQMISSVLSEDEVRRSEKVQALKSMIQSGTYSVDSSEVSKKIHDFLR